MLWSWEALKEGGRRKGCSKVYLLLKGTYCCLCTSARENLSLCVNTVEVRYCHRENRKEGKNSEGRHCYLVADLQQTWNKVVLGYERSEGKGRPRWPWEHGWDVGSQEHLHTCLPGIPVHCPEGHEIRNAGGRGAFPVPFEKNPICLSRPSNSFKSQSVTNTVVRWGNAKRLLRSWSRSCPPSNPLAGWSSTSPGFPSIQSKQWPSAYSHLQRGGGFLGDLFEDVCRNMVFMRRNSSQKIALSKHTKAQSEKEFVFCRNLIKGFIET